MADGSQDKTLLTRGRYQARLASAAADLEAVQLLRGLCFRAGDPDRDGFDTRCLHVMIEDTDTAALVGCYRMLILTDGAEIDQSYAAQFYDLSAFCGYCGPLAEVGRFCIRDRRGDADILRIAWGAMAALVDARGVRLLFGCSSFAGVDPAGYQDCLCLLAARHLAPVPLRPGIKAPEVVPFATLPRSALDQKAALRTMPPLLRTYLMMGGWVSDHAVVDRDLNTLHVFTAVEIDAIPDARKRQLRAVAAPV